MTTANKVAETQGLVFRATQRQIMAEVQVAEFILTPEQVEEALKSYVFDKIIDLNGDLRIRPRKELTLKLSPMICFEEFEGYSVEIELPPKMAPTV